MIYQLPGGQWKTPGLGQSETIALPGGWWEKKATSKLYTPARPKLLLGDDGHWHPMSGEPLPSLGAFGLTVTAAPPGEYPRGATIEEYTSGFSAALGGISPDVRSQMAATNPDMAIAVDGLSAIIEAVSGKEPGWPMAIEVARIVADVVVDLLTGNGAIGAAIQEAVQAAARAIGASMSAVSAAIPFVGIAVTMVCEIVGAATAPRISAADREAMDGRYQNYCRAKTLSNLPGGAFVGTDPFEAVSLADMFSQNDSRARVWRWLAGGASRHAGVRSAYNSWLSRAKGKYGIKGIPLHVMRQMNELMDGIFAARRDPYRKMGEEIFTDNGAGLGGVLFQITRDRYLLGEWSEASAQSLADNFVAPGRQVCVPASGRAGSSCDDYPPCGQHRLGAKLGVAFFRFIRGYDTAISDPTSPIYVDAKAAAEKAALDAPNKLTLSPSLAGKLTLQVQGTKAVAEEATALADEQLKANATAKRSSATKAAALSSAVLLGGGGFLMARRAAKKRRR